MNITNNTGLVGFLMALSTLSLTASPSASAHTPNLNIEARLSRLTQAIQERSQQLPASAIPDSEDTLISGWADGRGNRGWVDARRGNWVNGHRGSFVNSNPWRNGWGDRGSFFNHRPAWVNGGSFLNRR